jgi:hypothetical protein
LEAQAAGVDLEVAILAGRLFASQRPPYERVAVARSAEALMSSESARPRGAAETSVSG